MSWKVAHYSHYHDITDVMTQNYFLFPSLLSQSLSSFMNARNIPKYYLKLQNWIILNIVICHILEALGDVINENGITRNLQMAAFRELMAAETNFFRYEKYRSLPKLSNFEI